MRMVEVFFKQKRQKAKNGALGVPVLRSLAEEKLPGRDVPPQT